MGDKNLSVPAKRWGSVGAFLKEFPHLRTPLYLATMGYNKQDPRVGSAGILTMTPQINFPNIPIWERDKRVQAQINMIKYAYSKATPIRYVAHFKNFGPVSSTTGGGILSPFAEVFTRIGNPVLPVGWYEKHGGLYAWNNLQRGWLSRPGPFVLVAWKFLYPEWFAKISSTSLHSAFRTGSRMINIHWKAIISYYFGHHIANFEALTEDQLVTFREFYGVSDMKILPPKSISYVVTDDGPPLDREVWDNKRFWSDLFSLRAGKNMLQSVAELYPIKSTVNASNFRDLGGTFSLDRYMEGTLLMTKFRFKYIFNNYRFQVDPQLRIIIRYTRKRFDETVMMQQETAKTWRDYVGMAILGVTLTIATVGLASGVIATMAAPVVAAPATTIAPITVAPTSTLAPGVVTQSLTGAGLQSTMTYSGVVAASMTPLQTVGAIGATSLVKSGVTATKVVSTTGKLLTTAKVGVKVVSAGATVLSTAEKLKAAKAAKALQDEMDNLPPLRLPASTGSALQGGMKQPQASGGGSLDAAMLAGVGLLLILVNP